MDFRLSDEQTMLKESVDRFVAQKSGFEQVRAAAAGPEGFARADWQTFAELGWLMLMIPEDLGGLGGVTADAALLAESFGRGLVGAPFVSTAVLCAGLLARADRPRDQQPLLDAIGGGEAIVALATEESSSRYGLDAIAAQAKPVDSGFTLSGEKIVVPDGAAAGHFLVSAKLAGTIGLFLVAADAPGLTVRRYRTVDNRRAADLLMADTPASLMIADALAPLERAVDEAALLLVAEALGCMDAAMSITAEYLKTREQFGRTLSKFQVLTHRVADMFVRAETTRSMLLRGLSALDAGPEIRAAAVSAAMVTAIDAGEFVCGQAIQLHGGIGMAEENAVGHYYKRIRVIGRTWGDRASHARRHVDLTQA